MSEISNAILEANGDISMHLKNGTVRIPAKQGCYTISTGCGSGKTECCKSIIRQKHHEGILYCVDTISELHKMYQWIINNKKSIGISESDVIVISSDNEHKDFTRAYRDNPEILMSKQIVLITHCRFWTDMINYFLIYKPQQPDCSFNGDFKSLLARSDLRRYVIFDETPTFINPFFEMNKSLLAAFSDYIDGEWKCKDLDSIRRYYKQFIEGESLDPFDATRYKINRIKKDVVFELIPKYFSQWVDSSEVSIKFNPLCLCQPVVNTHIMIMEGVGDVLFHNSQHFKLIDLPQKYNCKVRFEQFEFNLKRRKDFDEKAYSDFIDWLSNRLALNIKQRKKTLVVTWMNQGKDASLKDKTYFNRIVSDLDQANLCKDSYSVIHYGSQFSKSTNEFRDYSEVILCGVWNITNADTSKFNQDYGLSISGAEHLLWAYIQLLCRIGIRMHDGGEYTVCYSSDFSQRCIAQLQDYFENKPLAKSQSLNTEVCPPWLSQKMEEARIRKKRRSEIIRLCDDIGDKLLLPIQRNQPDIITVPLRDLFSIVPRSRRKKHEYKALVRDLKKLGITLNIESKRAEKSVAT